ncbi:MAG: DUF4388 domain-containing protein [Nitrospirae bacterium]|nr:DUF4388 domain-containing protein [Nitrospirota bacterium]
MHDLSIYELLKRINHFSTTGVIFIKSGNSIGSIYIKDKRVVYAKYRMANEDESLREILSLNDGEYNWQEDLPPIRETINYFIAEASYTHLKKIIPNISVEFIHRLPDYNKKLVISPDLNSFRNNLKFSSIELTILNLIKEGTTINSLLRTTDILNEELLKTVYLLYLSDIIDIEGEGVGKKEGVSSESIMMNRLKGFGV